MSWLRHPRTIQEARENGNPEVVEYVRPKRNYSNLPNHYDDLFPVRERSWKAQRRGRKAWEKMSAAA